ncbi:dihydrolipoyl dehydrogenase family protein [Paramicrobacterium chengjingii]|uniref:NAD(P)/FAD-dependent oxidoreductase n=1 Tax=Paramicrobacterium chengjingii TaxID=2769067 RepID=A0ABX6YEP0_9MICO|nr:NAD(P)/FAD-dependent oxidoreductase [Microbacterium chengjingii]QPZ37259.1 NAD(P)/FAD-dependent oxidoreductase [Microbacterium chengjingii]
MNEYDIVVIGAGAVGENVADYATKAGLSCVIVENDKVGGECSYRACIPSKALLRSGDARRAALAVDGAAQAVTRSLDVARVLARRDAFTGKGDDSGQVSWLENAGIDLVRGTARLIAERTVEVNRPEGTQTLKARVAVAMCTGSEPRVPAIPGIEEIDIWTSREATVAEEIPASLAIVGGGVVATELATAFASLGSTVTVVARSGLLNGHEPLAGEAVTQRFRADGIDVLVADVDSISAADGGAQLQLSTGQTVSVARVLIATGRLPRTSDVGIETVNLAPGEWIDVDETMLVRGVPGEWLYAVGDLNHRSLLTHQGKYQARAAAAAIAARAAGDVPDTQPWSEATATADHGAIPSVVFSSPQVATVGMTEKEAVSAGRSVRTIDIALGSVAGGSLHADGYEGTFRTVVDTERNVVIGVTLVGDDVAELLHAATIAIVGEVPLHRLWHAVPAFPTMSEAWLRMLEALREPEAQ